MTSARYRASPRFADLGDGFFDVAIPARFPEHTLRFRNQRWADRVGLGALEASEWEAHFAKFEPLPGNLEKPLALRYHGHQFDVYNPHLGDGRGFLFAQLRDEEGRLLDLGTKGSGTTPWSRGGDGRLTLKGGVREILATEMLEAHGVYTSKSLSLFETGEALMRSDEPSPTRSSVLVRLSHSHIRFGTFQRLAYLNDRAGLDRLLSYSIENYFPHLASERSPVASFLTEVTQKSAVLTASWMVAGFVHGVLNSDNMTITGESFDYGPWRFVPTFDVDFVAAYFDHQGLYSFGNQPRAVFRNLMRLAESLRPLEPTLDRAAVLGDFEAVLQAETTRRVLARLGVVPRGDSDDELAFAVYAFLSDSGVPYDAFFFDLHGGRLRNSHPGYSGPEWDTLCAALEAYAPARDHLPAEPCTLLKSEVEAIWTAISERDDWKPFEDKVRAIQRFGASAEAEGGGLA